MDSKDDRHSEGLKNESGAMRVSILYVILCHDKPRQLLRLLRLLASDRDMIFIHGDRAAGSEFHNFIERCTLNLTNVRWIAPQLCTWGGWNLVAVVLDAIRMAKAQNVTFGHLMLLSGTDLPLVTADEVRKTIGDLGDKSSVTAWQFDPKDDKPQGGGRIGKSYIEALGEEVVADVVRDHLPDFQFRKGSQWVTLSAKFCDFLISEAAAEFREFFSRSFVPDEHFFATVVATTEFENHNIPWMRHYLKWGQGGRPVELGLDDYLEQRGKLLFARKFADEIPEQLEDYLNESSALPALEALVNRVGLPHVDTGTRGYIESIRTQIEAIAQKAEAKSGEQLDLYYDVASMQGSNVGRIIRVCVNGCDDLGVFVSAKTAYCVYIRILVQARFLDAIRISKSWLPAEIVNAIHPLCPHSFDRWHHLLGGKWIRQGIITNDSGVKIEKINSTLMAYLEYLVFLQRQMKPIFMNVASRAQ